MSAAAAPAGRGDDRSLLLVTSALAAALTAAVFASVAFGARPVGVGDVVAALAGSRDDLAQIAVAERVPRTVLAIGVGAALAVAGATLQGLTRNPLADPGLLGISSGASLAVVTAMAFAGLSSPVVTVWVAIAGAAVAAGVVWTIGSAGPGGPTAMKLTLAGAAVWAGASSLTSAVLLPRIDVMDRFRFWQIGGVGGAEWERMVQLVPFLVGGVALCAASIRLLDSLALGDDVATGLGVKPGRARLVAGAGAVILCGGATAIAGPIAFVGLVVPHLVRRFVGVGHRRVLPVAAVVGAVLLVVADVLGRLVTRPAELDVGIVTAFVGAPVFIWAVRRGRLVVR